MRTICVALSFIFTILITGCGVQQSKYDQLKAENDSLKKELDEFKYGTDRTIALIEKSYAEKDYKSTKENIELLSQKHPESNKNVYYKKYLIEIEKKEIEDRKVYEAQEKERIRLANLSNTGIWDVRHFVDEFGVETKNAYVRNTEYIEGTFSNSATQDSKLNVTFLIDNANDISVQLYEYARNNPVKGYSSQTYTVRVRDNDGRRYTLNATNYSDRLSFGSNDSRRLHNIFMKGGQIQFAITDDNTPTTQYKFDITNAKWYENAYSQLKGK